MSQEPEPEPRLMTVEMFDDYLDHWTRDRSAVRLFRLRWERGVEIVETGSYL